MIITLNTPKGLVEIQKWDNLYNGCPQKPSCKVLVRWPEAKDLKESEVNTTWLLMQLTKSAEILPLNGGIESPGQSSSV